MIVNAYFEQSFSGSFDRTRLPRDKHFSSKSFIALSFLDIVDNFFHTSFCSRAARHLKHFDLVFEYFPSTEALYFLDLVSKESINRVLIPQYRQCILNLIVF